MNLNLNKKKKFKVSIMLNYSDIILQQLVIMLYIHKLRVNYGNFFFYSFKFKKKTSSQNLQKSTYDNKEIKSLKH